MIMKVRVEIIIGFFLLIGTTAFSIPSEVVYTEGDAYIHKRSGGDYEAVIGDEVNTGDSVKTGADGYMELDRDDVTRSEEHTSELQSH